MPFALHTCGVTTVSTLHTNSYRTRLPHHYPNPHDPHALQEGRRLRSSRGRLRAARRNTTGKSAPAPPQNRGDRAPRFPLPCPTTSDIRRSNFNARTSRFHHTADSSLGTRSSPFRRRLLSPARREIKPHRPTLAAFSGPASFARVPAQEPHRAVRIILSPRTVNPARRRQQTLPGSRLLRSLPERDCCTAPAGIVPHRHPLRGAAGRSSPALPRRRSPALPSVAGRAVIHLQIPN